MSVARREPNVSVVSDPRTEHSAPRHVRFATDGTWGLCRRRLPAVCGAEPGAGCCPYTKGWQRKGWGACVGQPGDISGKRCRWDATQRTVPTAAPDNRPKKPNPTPIIPPSSHRAVPGVCAQDGQTPRQAVRRRRTRPRPGSRRDGGCAATTTSRLPPPEA